MMFDPESSTFRFLPAAVGVPGSLCCSSICTAAAAMDIGHTPRILEPASSSLQPCDAPLGASRAGCRSSCTPATAPPRQPPRLRQARRVAASLLPAPSMASLLRRDRRMSSIMKWESRMRGSSSSGHQEAAAAATGNGAGTGGAATRGSLRSRGIAPTGRRRLARRRPARTVGRSKT